MPAQLETNFGSLFQSTSPANRRRPMPKELLELERAKATRQLSSFETALLALGRDVYDPPREWFGDMEDQMSQVAEALRSTAIAAFTGRTTKTELTGDETVNSTTWLDLGGMEQTITVPAPARIHVTLVCSVELSSTLGTELFQQRVLLDGATQKCVGTARCPATSPTGFRWGLVSQDLWDLEPEIAYALVPQARVNSVGPTYIVRASTTSNFIVRVEPRSLSVIE